MGLIDRSRERERGQKGQAIVLIAIMLAVLVGMAALAIDGSRAYQSNRYESGQQRDTERHLIRVHQRNGNITADHRERTMREVHEPHQSHRERQTDRHDI